MPTRLFRRLCQCFVEVLRWKMAIHTNGTQQRRIWFRLVPVSLQFDRAQLQSSSLNGGLTFWSHWPILVQLILCALPMRTDSAEHRPCESDLPAIRQVYGNSQTDAVNEWTGTLLCHWWRKVFLITMLVTVCFIHILTSWCWPHTSEQMIVCHWQSTIQSFMLEQWACLRACVQLGWYSWLPRLDDSFPGCKHFRSLFLC